MYWILFIGIAIVSFIVQQSLQSKFKKYSQVPMTNGMTGKEVAEKMLRDNGIYDVTVTCTPGHLTDHYDPKANVIRLSDTVYGSDGVSAIGVAAHEAGHAVQYAKGYSPIKIRTAIFPVSRFGSAAAIPIFLIGIIFAYQPLMYAGIILFSLAALFQLVTLPVEFNASRRAVEALKGSGRFSEDEIRPVKKVLSAAALTYVAALASSLLSLLRLIVIAGGRRRD